MNRKEFKALCTILSNGCWIYPNATAHWGYGRLEALGEQLAHRVSWKLFKRLPIKGWCVLHKCDTPACVNPRHLFRGTRADNLKDCRRKGRWKHVEPTISYTYVWERLAAGATRRALAKELGCSHQRISQIKMQKPLAPHP